MAFAWTIPRWKKGLFRVSNTVDFNFRGRAWEQLKFPRPAIR